MVPYIYPSYRIGYNGGDDLSEFVLARHYKSRPEGSYGLWYVPTYKMVNKKYGKSPSKLVDEIP